MIDYARTMPPRPRPTRTTPYVAQNIQKLNFTGAELSLRWQLPRQQRIELSYTGIHGAGATLPGVQYLYVFNYPSTRVWRPGGARLPGGVDSRFRVAAVQRYGIGAYPLVEWTVGRQFEYLKPYLQLTNLTNTKYQEIAGVAMPGRGFIAGMEVRWKAK